MARPKILRGTYINILMGNGAAVEVFAPICGLTTRSFTHQVNTNDTFVRDCALPEDIPAREVIASGEQWDLNGSGLVDRSNLASLNTAMKLIKGFRFELLQPAGDAVFGGYWGGKAMLTQITVTGSDEEFASIELTMASSGPWAFTTVA